MVGGLVGSDSRGAITQAYATGAIFATDSGLEVGGLIGRIDTTTITQSYATGKITVTPVGNTSASIGGLVGDKFDGLGIGAVSSSYWDTQTTGQASSPVGVGMITSQLTAALPAGFNGTVWTIN